MNVLICFTGLIRSISETIVNLKENLLDSSNSFKVIYVTWDTEPVELFSLYFPESTIYKIPCITPLDSHFIDWMKNSTMHHSWINSYGSNENALFNYYRQIYLWKQAGIIMESYDGYDIFVRTRTDIVLSGVPVHTYYNRVSCNNIFFPNEPRHSIIGGSACPDYVLISSKQNFLYAIKILDNINFLFNKYKIPIQPETTMWFHLFDKNIEINYMENNVTVVRTLGFSKS
jgi:hypothetical protein